MDIGDRLKSAASVCVCDPLPCIACEHEMLLMIDAFAKYIARSHLTILVLGNNSHMVPIIVTSSSRLILVGAGLRIAKACCIELDGLSSITHKIAALRFSVAINAYLVYPPALPPYPYFTVFVIFI